MQKINTAQIWLSVQKSNWLSVQLKITSWITYQHCSALACVYANEDWTQISWTYFLSSCTQFWIDQAVCRRRPVVNTFQDWYSIDQPWMAHQLHTGHLFFHYLQSLRINKNENKKYAAFANLVRPNDSYHCQQRCIRRDVGSGGGTGSTCPQDFAINKEVPFLFSRIPL